MSSEGIKIVFGGAAFGTWPPFNDAEYNQKTFQILRAHGTRNIDTAQAYGQSEKTLGDMKAGDTFTIDTKCWGNGPPGWATKDYIVKSGKESLEKLSMKQVS